MGIGTKRWFAWIMIALLILWFIGEIHSILLPFVVGILSAYFLDPAADRLEKWGISRTMATALITCGFFVLLVLCGLIVVPLVVSQFSELMQALPEYISGLEQKYSMAFESLRTRIPPEQFENIRQALSNFGTVFVQYLANVAAHVFQSGIALLNLLSLVLITPVVTFYLLRDWDRLVARMDGLLPRPYADTIRAQFRNIDDTLAGFIRGQSNVCLILAVYYAFGLTLTGLKFGVIIGLMAGFLVIIPYAGVLFMATIALGIALFQFDESWRVIAVFGVFALGWAVEGNFITPKLVGEKVGLHPVWIIFGMLAGAAMFGFVGVLIAVPVTAVIGVLIRFAIATYLESGLYHGTP
jgi:predicted PurR-regulated permease PerM